MARIENWRAHIDAWLRDNSARAFGWGSWDCCLMVAAHIDGLRGTGLYAAHAGHYTTEETANAYLATLSPDGLSGLAAQILGEPLPTWRLAQSGDVLGFDTPAGPALGFLDLSGLRIVGLSPSEAGFVFLPRAVATAAWRV